MYVVPRSSRTEVVGIYDDALKIKLKASPFKGAANKELVKFLAEKLDIPRAKIGIVKGHKHKRKVVSVCGIKDLKCLYENF